MTDFTKRVQHIMTRVDKDGEFTTGIPVDETEMRTLQHYGYVCSYRGCLTFHLDEELANHNAIHGFEVIG